MQDRLYLPKEDRIESLSTELYLEIDDDLKAHFEQHGTYKDETLLENVNLLILDVVVNKVATTFASESPEPTRQAIAYEAFYFALKICNVLPGKPAYAPVHYYVEDPHTLKEKMSKDYYDYAEQHEVIKKLLDEHLCNIDQFGNDFVMAETFAAVVIMQIEIIQARAYIEAQFGSIALNFANESS